MISERDPIERTGDGAWRLGVVDEELDISVGAAEVEQLAQCRWSVLPRSQGHAVDDDVLHFEHRTRCGQGSSDFGQREARRRSLMRVPTSRRNRLRTVWKHSGNASSVRSAADRTHSGDPERVPDGQRKSGLGADCGALVLFMTPGLAFFYGGMDRRRNVLNMLMMNFYCLLIIPILWMVAGYSLAQVPFENDFIGTFDAAFLRDITEVGDGGTLAIVAYLGMFAVITPALIGRCRRPDEVLGVGAVRPAVAVPVRADLQVGVRWLARAALAGLRRRHGDPRQRRHRAGRRPRARRAGAGRKRTNRRTRCHW